MANPLKAVGLKVDKFTAGNKTQLMEERKQEDDKKMRALEQQREKDAQDLKAAYG